MLSSRRGLSGLFGVLAESLEAEFATVLTPMEGEEKDGASDALATVIGQADILQDLIRVFRMYDGVGPALCGAVFTSAARLMSAWSTNIGTAAGASLTYLAPAHLSTARSCSIDILVAIVLLAKVSLLVRVDTGSHSCQLRCLHRVMRVS